MAAQVGWQMGQGSVEVVDGRQQLAQHVLASFLALLPTFAIDTALVVEEVGALALELLHTRLVARGGLGDIQVFLCLSHGRFHSHAQALVVRADRGGRTGPGCILRMAGAVRSADTVASSRTPLAACRSTQAGPGCVLLGR